MKLGYLAKVNEPTDWVNLMVKTEKRNVDVRISIDPKDPQQGNQTGAFPNTNEGGYTW